MSFSALLKWAVSAITGFSFLCPSSRRIWICSWSRLSRICGFLALRSSCFWISSFDDYFCNVFFCLCTLSLKLLIGASTLDWPPFILILYGSRPSVLVWPSSWVVQAAFLSRLPPCLLFKLAALLLNDELLWTPYFSSGPISSLMNSFSLLIEDFNCSLVSLFSIILMFAFGRRSISRLEFLSCLASCNMLKFSNVVSKLWFFTLPLALFSAEMAACFFSSACLESIEQLKVCKF